jgi:hypothetical protein
VAITVFVKQLKEVGFVRTRRVNNKAIYTRVATLVATR